MRIGLIKQRFVGFGGGSERYTTGLVTELRKLGHDLQVFAAVWDAAAEAAQLTLHRVPVAGGASFARQLSFALNCRRALARTRCDLVFSLERTLRQDIVRAGGGCHREYLIQRRRYVSPLKRLSLPLNPLHRSLLWLERRTFSPANTRVVIANSHLGREEIIRHYGFPAERIHVVLNAVDVSRFQPAPRAAQPEFVLLFVGSGFERKGLAFAVRVLAQLPAHVHLHVAGKGDSAPYERLARRLGVAGRVKFLGPVAKIEAAYAAGDLLLHPAIYEPFSNACLEALACGRPVVTSRINGASEAIVPGKNGAIVDDPGDINALAAAIRPFLEPAHWAAAAQHARETAEAMPFSRNVEQTLDIIAQVGGGR